MEILNFYWANIMAGIVLVFVLGLIGRHLIARNQSMEVMLLGQEFQTSILIAAIVMGLFESGQHDDHSLHFEAIITLVLVLISHSFYILILKKNRSFRIEGAISYIILLMGLGHIIVLTSPLVEFHMIKSSLGDIVTVSKLESILVTCLGLISSLVIFKIHKNTYLDTLEFALFNKPTKKRKSYFIFSSIVLILMLFSIHLFGSLFTVGSIIIPAFITGILNINNKHYMIITFLNSLSVVGAFAFLLLFDRLPTTVLILFFIFITTLVYSLIANKLNRV
ncbi:MAG: ABC-type Mn2+/Zn2+ transport system permease subunit [Thermoproteota archaeon]|jgi:ABC-type Mn2+/Zn2+ transport system permease subunit